MNNKTILIVEDEKRIREFILIYLKKEGFNCIEACNGLEGFNAFNSNRIDLILLDIMMPEIGGLELCKMIRKKSNTPIIFLTAIDQDLKEIESYEFGADDYITKPFKIKILIAKIKRIFERTKFDDNQNIFEYSQLKVNFNSRNITINNEIINMAPKEYEVFEYLIRNKNIVLSRNQILEKVWGYSFNGSTRVVDNHIKKIRNKLDSYSNLIKTAVGVGYKFEV